MMAVSDCEQDYFFGEAEDADLADKPVSPGHRPTLQPSTSTVPITPRAILHRTPDAHRQSKPTMLSLATASLYVARSGLGARLGYTHAHSLALPSRSRSSLATGMKVINPARAPTVAMKADIVLADKDLEAKIMKVVSAEPAKTKSAALCSQMAAANLERIRMDDADGGCAPNGPPFTEPTGLGWDVSTEPKNEADMKALAIKLNPVVGYWGAPRRCLRTHALLALFLSTASPPRSCPL